MASVIPANFDDGTDGQLVVQGRRIPISRVFIPTGVDDAEMARRVLANLAAGRCAAMVNGFAGSSAAVRFVETVRDIAEHHPRRYPVGVVAEYGDHSSFVAFVPAA